MPETNASHVMGPNDNVGSATAAEIDRRGLLFGSAVIGAASAATAAAAQAQTPLPPPPPPGTMPPLGGEVAPPPKGAGAIRAGRGSMLQGKVAVVTGAARGIGRAIAVELAANGADVAVLDICGPVSPASNAKPATPEDLAETAHRIRELGRRCTPITADIRDISALRAAADRVEQTHGQIDIVVANAAIQRWKPLLEMEDSDWRDVIDNNLNGTANTIRAFAPKLVARNYGRIIALSSMQGKHGTKNAASYSASKWGILGLMKSAAMELGAYNITVNALLPGLVDTDLTRYEARYRNSMGETQADPPQNPTAEEAWAARAPTVPLKVGWLEPEDISPAAVFLASDAAAMVTGADYEVTGGDSAKDI